MAAATTGEKAMSARVKNTSCLPPALQKQAEAQLSPRGVATTGTVSTGIRAASACPGAAQAGGLAKKAGPRLRHGPNKTEAAFRDWFLSTHLVEAHELHYEGLTFRLPGGSRYTPDWVLCMPLLVMPVRDDPKGAFFLTCFEVKGSYRLGSHGRALTAFREARAAFQNIKFRWFEKSGGGFVEKYEEERGATP
jgi:hypothetical protein